MINRDKLKIESLTGHRKDKELDSFLVKRIAFDTSNQSEKPSKGIAKVNQYEESAFAKDHRKIIDRMKEGLIKAPSKTLDMISKFYKTPISDKLTDPEHWELLMALVNAAKDMSERLFLYFSLLQRIFEKMSINAGIESHEVG